MTPTVKLSALVCALASLFFLGSNSAFALGTLANTPISNTATLVYDVNGVSQPNITSPAATFLVDNKVNLDVATSNSPTIVTPAQSQAVNTFTVTNLGNAVQDYALTGGNVVGAATVFGSADTFDALACNTFVETNGIAGYQAGVDTAPFIDELAPDASKDVYVVCSIPAAIPTNQQAVTELTAVTRAGVTAGLGAVLTQSAGIDNPAVVDIVFADPVTIANALGTVPAQTPRDATAFARNAYRVAAVAVTVNKAATCSPAPANCSAAKTGTVITYQLLVTITGSGSADALVITDPLPANLTYSGSLIVSPSATSSDFGVTTPNTLTVNFGNITAPANLTIQFNATIN